MSFPQFEEVLLSNLPERTDKLDGFALTATLAGFTFMSLPASVATTFTSKSL